MDWPGLTVIRSLVLRIERSVAQANGIATMGEFPTPVAPRVAPLTGNSVTVSARLTPCDPPLTLVAGVPPERATKPPPPPPPGPWVSWPKRPFGLPWVPPLPPLASTLTPAILLATA